MCYSRRCSGDMADAGNASCEETDESFRNWRGCQKMRARIERVQSKIDKTKGLIRDEQSARDQKIQRHLRLVSQAEQPQQLAHLRSLYEMKYAQSAKVVDGLQRKLDSYQRLLKDLQSQANFSQRQHRAPERVVVCELTREITSDPFSQSKVSYSRCNSSSVKVYKEICAPHCGNSSAQTSESSNSLKPILGSTQGLNECSDQLKQLRAEFERVEEELSCTTSVLKSQLGKLQAKVNCLEKSYAYHLDELRKESSETKLKLGILSVFVPVLVLAFLAQALSKP